MAATEALGGASERVSTPGGYWRDGDVLVMHKRARLPDRCVLTGEPAGLRVTRTFVWTPRSVALTALLSIVGIGLPLFLILSALKSKRAVVSIPISTAALETQKKYAQLAWVGTGLALLVGILGFVRGITPRHAPWLIVCFLGLGVFCAAFTRAHRIASILTLEGMTDEIIRFGGVHNDVLAGMPAWTPDAPENPRWEWSLPNGESVVASYDPVTHTETVWLGSSLVSRAITGEKPDGHMVALTAGIAFRGAGVAEVRFAPAIQSCSLELDGTPIATSPFSVDPSERLLRPRTQADNITALALAVGVPVGFGALGILALVFTYVQTAPRKPTAESLALSLDGGAPLANDGGASDPNTLPYPAMTVTVAGKQRLGFIDAGGPAPTATTDPFPVSTGKHACIDGAYTCSEDGREILQCKTGRLLLTYRACRGPAGCKMSDPTTPNCDQSIVEQGDACWLQGKLACNADGSALFTCVAGSFVRTRPCKNTACSVNVPGRVACD